MNIIFTTFADFRLQKPSLQITIPTPDWHIELTGAATSAVDQ